MKILFAQMRSRGVALKTALVLSSLVVATSAHAALPAWAEGIITAATTSVNDVIAAVGPVIAVGVGATIVITLIKRYSSKI